MLQVTGLGKSFGAQVLFSGVSLQLNARERYGVVGANGSGKTTFLKILTGDEAPSEGSITIPKSARLGVLRQDRFLDDAVPIVDLAMMGDREVYEALVEQQQWSEGNAPSPERVVEVEEQIARHEGYTLRSRASAVLAGLGVPEGRVDQPLRSLSGGFKLRVLLAQVLVGRPEVLLLDEPTNHLDILSIRWLEDFLRSYDGCAVIISHDHLFLNRVATHILDVDYQAITPYVGNYDQFVVQKEAARAQKEAEIARAEKLLAEKRAFVERFRAKASKARQAQSRVKQIEKIEIETLPQSSRRYPKFRFEAARPSGKDVLHVEGVCKAYEHPVLRDVHFSVRRGERVALIGANGLGKSTLAKILVDRLAADAGTHEWGHEVRLGYFAQDHREVLGNLRQTALDFIWDACPQEGSSFVRGQLGRVLFSSEEVDKPLATLSGGEAARLVFCRLMVEKPNVLVLDEPTNHLDLEAISALVEALRAFEGTLLFVSHDRWFVGQLATRVLELLPEGLSDFPGSYDEYLARSGADHLDQQAVVLRAKQEKREREAERPLSWEERKRMQNRRKALPKKRDALLEEVERLERRLAEIDASWADPSFVEHHDAAAVERLQEEQQQLSQRIAEATEEWEQVEEELAQLGG